MIHPRNEPLSERLRRDAATALPEPSPGLSGAIDRALSRKPLPSAGLRRRTSPPVGAALWLGAAAALLLLVTWLSGAEDGAYADPPLAISQSPTVSRRQGSELSPAAGVAPRLERLPPVLQPGEPLQALGAVVDEVLMTEWHNLSRDARGTAHYLLAQVQGPVVGLHLLANSAAAASGSAATIAAGSVPQHDG